MNQVFVTPRGMLCAPDTMPIEYLFVATSGRTLVLVYHYHHLLSPGSHLPNPSSPTPSSLTLLRQLELENEPTQGIAYHTQKVHLIHYLTISPQLRKRYLHNTINNVHHSHQTLDLRLRHGRVPSPLQVPGNQHLQPGDDLHKSGP